MAAGMEFAHGARRIVKQRRLEIALRGSTGYKVTRGAVPWKRISGQQPHPFISNSSISYRLTVNFINFPGNSSLIANKTPRKGKWAEYSLTRQLWKSPSISAFRNQSATPLQVVDIFFSRRNHPYGLFSLADDLLPPDLPVEKGDDERKDTQELTAEICGSESAFEFLRNCIRVASETNFPRQARLLIPLQQGTIIRSDILPLRLRDAFWIEDVASFSDPLRVFSGGPVESEIASIPELVRASAGGMLVKLPNRSNPQDHSLDGVFRTSPSSDLETDFEGKLSFSWVSTVFVPLRRCVVLVGCSSQDPAGGGFTQFVHRAAVALGIDLVILDRADGWLAQGGLTYSDWYEALLPAPGIWWSDPSRPNMADEIVALVHSYLSKSGKKKTVDGIITFTEAFQVPVSIAGERLGLPYQNPASYETATNKHKLGKSQKRPAILAASASEALAEMRDTNLDFPVIVKPCFGLNSEGVSRVTSTSEMQAAVSRARSVGRSKKYGDGKILIEPYCSGPEVDVNMIFVDGEVMFTEICDDFPKVGDNGVSGAGAATADVPSRRSNFHETAMVYPSALPRSELASLQDAVRDTIKGIGFTNGVMHVEARIADSACEYVSTSSARQNGKKVLDLQPKESPQKVKTVRSNRNLDFGLAAPVPTPWIIEINPRPPGVFASQTPESVYGVDYWGVSLALCTGDSARAKALSRPFAPGPQIHAVLVMIRAEFDSNDQGHERSREGIFDSDDVCAELLDRRPELIPHIGRRGCLLKRGQRIPHPASGRNTFVAYFNVFSRTSRREALEVAQTVREEVRYTIS
ncbi:hypothetical protein F5Y16DRAFT_418812 [Xylariaceae sp. FL0255]|nr:hypothetical protein F5Y16DRAFT_418812 [Xylariaceae sp. FL0255]